MISPRGLFVSPKILKSLREFPRPTSQKAMRSFMGLAEQTAPFLMRAEKLHPFREILKMKPGDEFIWSNELAAAFEHAKGHLIREAEHGIRTFDVERTTMVTTDWSKLGMGTSIFQKYCDCEADDKGNLKLDCCTGGWKLVLMDSRFCSDAEGRYAPKEGRSQNSDTS